LRRPAKEFRSVIRRRTAWRRAATIAPHRCGSLAVLLLALSGCSPTAPITKPAPMFPQSDPVPTLPVYHIQVGDVLLVKLYLNPDLSDTVTVRPDGMISTSLAQDVRAFGRTPAEVADDLRNAYRKVLTDPQLSLIVQTFAPSRIYVAGEVESPGEFLTVGPNLTLGQAIARAGGVKPSAAKSHVFIIRRGPGDVPEYLSTDYAALIGGEDPHADVRLAQYDIVYVPKTGVAEVYTFFNQFLQQFISFNWGFDYNINPIVR
jgi:polysaccharide biosynthesis/export protein